MASRIITAAVEDIFAYWQQVMDKPRAKLTPGRKTKVAARLENYSVADIKQAILGCRATPWNMGQNPQGTLYNSLEFICRNDEQVERFIETAFASPSRRFGENPEHI